MADKTPLKFEFSGATPSSVAEFTDTDTVSVRNGGTGVSALSSLALSLSATDVSSNTVSSLNFFVPDGGAFNCMGLDGEKFFMKRENGATYENLIKSDEGTITIQSEDDIHFLSNTGEKFMRLNESGGDGEVELYYNNSLKLETIDTGVTITGDVNGMPYPAPFGYIQLTADDTLSTDEKRVAYSNTPTSVVSDAAHMSWNDTLKQFEVSSAGTYEVIARVVFEGGSGLVQMKIVKDTTAQNTATPRVHTTVDPVERTLSAIFTCVAGDPIYVTYDSQSSNTVGSITGTTVTVKRIK